MGLGYMMGNDGYMGGGFMIIFWVIILVAIVVLFRWGINLPQRDKNVKTNAPTPLDILGERLAKGEIDIVEYNEKKRLLYQEL